MTSPAQGKILWSIGRILLTALLFAAIILSGRFSRFWDTGGLAFVFAGGVALFLMSFSLPQIRIAARYAAGRPVQQEDASMLPFLWEALARNFWVAGVLGSIASFVLSLARESEGIQQVAFLLTASFRPAFYGMFLAAVCAIPALKSRGDTTRPEENSDWSVNRSQNRRWTFENVAGSFLLIGILVWTIVLPASRGFLQEQRLLSFFFDPSALLVVVGGTVVMMIFMRRTPPGAALTIGLAVTGLLGSLMGLMQALFAFTQKSIQDVASALAFVISSCFLALLGMILVALPLADHEVAPAGRSGWIGLKRLAWYLFPLLALLFLILTFIAVITPIKM